jgi:4-amino-4-deoxy-L-arabinose transferase-like glycosyltransferase
MLVLLPLFSLGLLVEVFRRYGFDWRRRILFATIPWSLYLVLCTEALSTVHLLTKLGISLAWLLFALACVWWLVASRKGTLVQQSQARVGRLAPAEKVAVGLVALIAGLVGLTALIAPPNTWDAMEYHMPRVAEWAMHHSLELYPTIDHHQLSMPPMAEYAMLHLYILFGNDQLVNFVQWFAYIGCILTVTLIVEILGGSSRAQVFSAVLTATLPSAVLGASGAKNDQVLSYWIALMMYFLILWTESNEWPVTSALGSTISLAIFSKGTAYAFIPFLVVAAMFLWDKSATRRFIFRLPVFAALVLILSLPLWLRNYQFSGSALGPPYAPGAGSEESRAVRNPHMTPTRVLACVFRNVALHVGVPNDNINNFTTNIFSRLIRVVGVDPDDPGQIAPRESGATFAFSVPRPTRAENSPNPFHFLLFWLAGAIYLIYWKTMDRSTGVLGLGIVAAFILFSALVRWTPSNTRYHLPLFTLAAAFIALVMVRVLSEKVIAGLSLLLAILSAPFVLMHYARPLVPKSGLKDSILLLPRDDVYFLDGHADYAPSFIAAAKAVTEEECSSIGLDANLLRFDYPMIALLSKDGKPRQISYVSVDNSTANYKPISKSPCAVVCLECAHSIEKWQEYSDSEPKPSVFESIVVFRYPQGLPTRTSSANAQAAPGTK